MKTQDGDASVWGGAEGDLTQQVIQCAKLIIHGNSEGLEDASEREVEIVGGCARELAS